MSVDDFTDEPRTGDVIPFPRMRPSPQLTERWTKELESHNAKLSPPDVIRSPLDCLDEIIRRRTLPVFQWPAAWPELARRARCYPGDVVVVTGPTGSGKTSWAIQVALSFTANGIPVLWCPLELDPTQITERIVANMHGVHTMAIKEHWPRERIAHSLAAVQDMWRFVGRIVDTDKQLAALERAIDLVYRVYRIKPLVVIDYLGKLAALSRDIRLATIQAAEHVRAMAVDKECFVLMLAQPSRAKNQALTGKVEHETAADTSGSAAESGEAENAASIEINLEVFKADDAEQLDARWNVAKSRHVGREGKVGARFKKPGGVWEELDYVPAHPLEVKAKVEKDKKDQHRTAPPPTPVEARKELNETRKDDANTLRRAKLLEALRRAGTAGLHASEMRNLAGFSRGMELHRSLQELERAHLAERTPGDRWRAISKIG